MPRKIKGVTSYVLPGSLWRCPTCRAEVVTTPGGPAPLCRADRKHGELQYCGGVRVVLPDPRYVGDNRIVAARSK